MVTAIMRLRLCVNQRGTCFRSILFNLLLFCLFVLQLPAQELRISLKDSSEARPISGARVSVRYLDTEVGDTLYAAVSKADGSLVVPGGGRVSILVQSLGYHNYRDTLDLAGDITLYLRPNSILMGEVVATAQHRPQEARNSLHKVRVLDKQKLRGLAAQNLQDALRLEGGMQISQDPLLGSGLSIQGMSGENIKILIDGVPVIGRLDGNIDLGQLSLVNVERIEIVEGPLSVEFGSDALAGVVNLITADGPQTQVNASLDSYLESVGNYDVDARLGYANEYGRIVATGGRHLFDGVERQPGSRTHSWKPREQYFAGWRYATPWQQTKLRYKGDYYSDKIMNRGTPRAPYGESAFDEFYLTSRLDNSIEFRSSLDSGHGLTGTLAYSRYRREKQTYIKDLITLSEQATGPADQDTTRFSSWLIRAAYSYAQPDELLILRAGIDINLEDSEGGRIESGSQEINDYAAFGQLQYRPLPDLAIQPGLRYTYNDRYDAPLIPSLHVKYDLSRSFQVRGSYARGFRSPSLKELFLFFVDINHNIRGNPDLKAEQSHNYMLAVDFKELAATGLWQAEAQMFFNDVSDRILLLQRESDLYSYINVGEFRSIGGRIKGGWHNENLSVVLTLANTGRKFISGNAALDKYSFTPELSLSNEWESPFFGIKSTLNYKYSGQTNQFTLNDDGEVVEGHVEDYHVLDLAFARSILDETLRIQIGAKNLLDVSNISLSSGAGAGDVHSSAARSIPIAWGRSIYLNMSYSLK